MSEKNSNGAFVAGLVLGGMVGAVAGLLAAPRSGKDTRTLLKKTAQALPQLTEDFTTTVQMRTDKLSQSSRRNWEGTLARLKEAIAAGIAASQLESETPNPLKDSPSEPTPTHRS